MFKFVCVFLCAFAAASASPYARPQAYGKTPVGGYAYQVQPVLTVKALVPGGGYGGHSYAPKNYGSNYAPSYGHNYGSNYGHNYGKLVEVPVSQVYTKNEGYGYGPAPVDAQSIALAKLSVAAPNAGRPLLWKEPHQYAHVQDVESYAKPSYGQQSYAKPSYGQESYSKPSYGQQSYAKPSYGQESYGEKAQGASAAAASSSVSGQQSSY